MSESAELRLGDKTISLPIIEGSEGERAIDISKLRSETGYITLDPGYRNTGSVESDITFINGEEGILRYRGYAIADLCENCTFLEVAWLLIFGELPTASELQQLTSLVEKYATVDADVLSAIDGFPNDGHPMAKFAASIQAASCSFKFDCRR